jgi:hypothetical protein
VTDHRVIVHSDHKATVHQDNRAIVHRVTDHQDAQVRATSVHVRHAPMPMVMSLKSLRAKDSVVAIADQEAVPVATVVVIVDHVAMEKRVRTKADASIATLDPRKRKDDCDINQCLTKTWFSFLMLNCF